MDTLLSHIENLKQQRPKGAEGHQGTIRVPIDCQYRMINNSSDKQDNYRLEEQDNYFQLTNLMKKHQVDELLQCQAPEFGAEGRNFDIFVVSESINSIENPRQRLNIRKELG